LRLREAISRPRCLQLALFCRFGRGSLGGSVKRSLAMGLLGYWQLALFCRLRHVAEPLCAQRLLSQAPHPLQVWLCFTHSALTPKSAMRGSRPQIGFVRRRGPVRRVCHAHQPRVRQAKLALFGTARQPPCGPAALGWDHPGGRGYYLTLHTSNLTLLPNWLCSPQSASRLAALPSESIGILGHLCDGTLDHGNTGTLEQWNTGSGQPLAGFHSHHSTIPWFHYSWKLRLRPHWLCVRAWMTFAYPGFHSTASRPVSSHRRHPRLSIQLSTYHTSTAVSCQDNSGNTA
jgi:hypothetical protein